MKVTRADGQELVRTGNTNLHEVKTLQFGAVDKRVYEAGNTKSSILIHERVIAALVEEDTGHPKRILQDSRRTTKNINNSHSFSHIYKSRGETEYSGVCSQSKEYDETLT